MEEATPGSSQIQGQPELQSQELPESSKASKAQNIWSSGVFRSPPHKEEMELCALFFLASLQSFIVSSQAITFLTPFLPTPYLQVLPSFPGCLPAPSSLAVKGFLP